MCIRDSTHGDGDGGLFTGILVRYLALAARSPALPSATREVAARLVRDNAHLLWDCLLYTSRCV